MTLLAQDEGFTSHTGLVYPKGWTVQKQADAYLKAYKGWQYSEALDDPEASAKARQAFGNLYEDTLLLMEHPNPQVQGFAAELLVNTQHDILRREAGEGPMSGSVAGTFRRNTGAAFDALSPVSSHTIGEDWGERFEAARSTAEFLNAGYQPMTKGWFSGSEDIKDSTTTKWTWGMLDPDAYWIPEEVASQDYSFDRTEMHYRSQLKMGERQVTPDGREYVVTNKGNVEIPTHVTGRDGVSYSIQDKANAIKFAQAGVNPEGPGSIIGDRGIIGSLWYDYGSDMVEGVHRDITFPGGEQWPFVPNITGDFELDRANLDNPAYRRALQDAAGDATFGARASLAGGAMLQELGEYVGVAGIVSKVGKGAKALFVGGRSADMARKARSMSKDRLGKPAVAGAQAATAAGRTHWKNGIPEFAKWSARDAVNEVALGIGQSMAEGGTVTEGVIKGTNEIIVEGVAKALGTGVRTPATWLGGRILGARVRDMRERARISRDDTMGAAQARIDFKTSGDLKELSDEIQKIVHDRAVVEWAKAVYDTSFMSLGLASQQVAMEQAYREGVDWQSLTIGEKASRIFGAVNDSYPEALGNWMAMMAGASPGMAQQFGSIKGYYRYQTDDGAQLQALLGTVTQLGEDRWADMTQEDMHSWVLGYGRMSDAALDEVLQQSLDPESGVTEDAPSPTDLSPVVQELAVILSATEGLAPTEAVQLAIEKLGEAGALANRGRLQEFQQTELTALRANYNPDADPHEVVPISASFGTRFLDPETGRAVATEQYQGQLPDNFRNVATFMGWIDEDGVLGGQGKWLHQALLHGDDTAKRIMAEATDLYVGVESPQEVARKESNIGHLMAGVRDKVQEIQSGRTALETDPKQKTEGYLKDTLSRLMHRVGSAAKSKMKQKSWLRPFREAMDGAPAFIAIPAIKKKLKALLPGKQKKGWDNIPRDEFGGKTANEMADAVYSKLSRYKRTGTTKATRMILDVDWLLSQMPSGWNPEGLDVAHARYLSEPGEQSAVVDPDLVDEGRIKSLWARRPRKEGQTSGRLKKVPGGWVHTIPGKNPTTEDGVTTWAVEPIEGDFVIDSIETLRAYSIALGVMSRIHPNKDSADIVRYAQRMIRDRMEAWEVLARGAASRSAQYRREALDLVRELDTLNDLPDRGHEVEGLLSAIARGEPTIQKLFEARWGEKGAQKFEQAKIKANQAVKSAQEAALMLTSQTPRIHARLRVAILVSEALQNQVEMPQWLLNQATQMKLLDVTADGGYQLRTGSLEAIRADIQVFSRLAEIPDDVAGAMSAWSYTDHAVPVPLLERAMDSIPGARGGTTQSRWESFIDAINPLKWPDPMWAWIPKAIKNPIIASVNRIGGLHSPFRSEQALEGVGEGIKAEERSSSDMLDVREAVVRMTRDMEEYLARPGVTRDHARLLTKMIHKGVFRMVTDRAEFIRRFEGLVGDGAGALHDIAMQYVTASDLLGQKLVDLGMMDQAQYDRWKGGYIYQPRLSKDEISQRLKEHSGTSVTPIKTSQLLSRTEEPSDALSLMDFTAIAPLGLMREAANVRMAQMFYSIARDGSRTLVRADSLDPDVLARDYVVFADPDSDNYVTRGMWYYLNQMRMSLDPVTDDKGAPIPDGSKIRELRAKLGLAEGVWTGRGVSDPKSPWFENTTVGGSKRAVMPDGTVKTVESHGGAFPRNGKMDRMLDDLLSYDTDHYMETLSASGNTTGEIRPTWVIDTNTHEMLHNMLNDMYRDSSVMQQSVHETIAIFRRMKTLYSPKHWIKNFISSPILNWTSGGVGLLDFARGFVFKSGDYYESNRLLALWSESYNPERLAAFNGDRNAMIRSWTPRQRGDLATVEEYLSLSGGATATGAILDPLTVENLTDGLLNGEVRVEDLVSGNQADKHFGYLAKQLQRFAGNRTLAARAQDKMFDSGQRREIAKALHSVSSEYATTEHFFKLANALHHARKRNMPWPDAVRYGAKGTADYAGVGQPLKEWTTNWRGVWDRPEAPWFQKEKGQEAWWSKERLGIPFARFYFGNVFWMFNAGALPAQVRGAFTHPMRAASATAFAASAAYALQKALGNDDEDEKVREALHEVHGMESWAALGEDELREILNELRVLMGGDKQVSFAGGEYTDDVVSVLARLLSTQPFRGVSAPKGGRSRVFSTEELAPMSVRVAMNATNGIASLSQGHFPRGSEMKSWMQGFLPASIKGTIGWYQDLVDRRKGETLSEQAVRGAMGAGRQFGAMFHPVAILGAPELIKVYEAMNGRSIYDMARGIRTPDWENTSIGTRMLDVGISQVFPTKTVYAFPAEVDTREFLLASRVLENLLPDLKTQVEGTPEERLLARAMRNSMEQMIKNARDAYEDHFTYTTALGEGVAVTFDQLLVSRFDVTKDFEYTPMGEPYITNFPVTDTGRFIRGAQAEDPMYGWMVQQASTKMIRDYIFRDKRYYTLLEMGRRRMLDPSTFELVFRGMMDGSNSDVLKLIHNRVVKQKDTTNFKALYRVFNTIPADQVRGVLGQRYARELYEVFAANGMFEDVTAPNMQDLDWVFGSKKWSLQPHQTVWNMGLPRGNN